MQFKFTTVAYTQEIEIAGKFIFPLFFNSVRCKLLQQRATAANDFVHFFIKKKGFDAIKIYKMVLWRRSQEVELDKNSDC